MPGAEQHLSRRERQIMDVIYAKGAATAAEVHDAISDPPSRTSVRTLLRILETKGHLTHVERWTAVCLSCGAFARSSGQVVAAARARHIFRGFLGAGSRRPFVGFRGGSLRRRIEAAFANHRPGS